MAQAVNPYGDGRAAERIQNSCTERPIPPLKMMKRRETKMSEPALNISPEVMTAYRAAARQRWEQEQRDLIQRKTRAWKIAWQAAALLKDQFGAVRVVVFGSLAHEHWFSQTSDVDLAAWGLDIAAYLHILGKLQDLSSEFKIDLVDINHCNLGLKKVIEREGIPL